jgi:ATP-dependent DNA helicase PIF1
LWVNQKLVNGTIGTVVAILYPENSSGPPNLPAGVVIHVPSYNGPGYDGKAGHILVTPMEIAHMYQGRMRVTRTQLPLTLAWGITIHKSQGMTIGDGRTIPRIKVHFGNREFSLGLTFVALSRVTSLGCIAFEPMPTYDRMLSICTSTLLQARLREMTRIDQLAAQTDERFTHLRGMSLP